MPHYMHGDHKPLLKKGQWTFRFKAH